MKSGFETVVIIFITMSIFICFILFSEEILIRQESINLRSKINEIIEINSGYTDVAKTKIDGLLSNLKYPSNIYVSKTGKLNYGEEFHYSIKIYNERKLPFLDSEAKNVSYEIKGMYFHIND